MMADAAAAVASTAVALASEAAAFQCHCPRGWSASVDCSTRDDECPVGCSGHGLCGPGGVCHGPNSPTAASSVAGALHGGLRRMPRLELLHR